MATLRELLRGDGGWDSALRALALAVVLGVCAALLVVTFGAPDAPLAARGLSPTSGPLTSPPARGAPTPTGAHP